MYCSIFKTFNTLATSTQTKQSRTVSGVLGSAVTPVLAMVNQSVSIPLIYAWHDERTVMKRATYKSCKTHDSGIRNSRLIRDYYARVFDATFRVQ